MLTINKELLIKFSEKQGYNKLVIDLLRNLKDSEVESEDELEILRRKLCKKKPELFTESLNKEKKNRILAKHRIEIEKAKDYSELLPSIAEFKKSRNTFLQACANISILKIQSRKKHLESIRSGIESKDHYVLTDRIGFRIIVEIKDYLKLFEHIRKEYSHQVAFSINTFLYNSNEMVERIGRFGRFYRSHDLYLYNDNREQNTEIQLITPALHVWITLNHDTNYKPILDVSGKIKKEIDNLGLVANYNDYMAFLEN